MSNKFRRTILAAAGVQEPIQTLTGASTGTTVLGYGITKITVASATESTAADFVFTLAAPVATGVHKYLFVSPPDATTKEVSVRTLTSVATFFDSTSNALTFSTVAGGPAGGYHLIGLTTVQWGVIVAKPSTAAAPAGATA